MSTITSSDEIVVVIISLTWYSDTVLFSYLCCLYIFSLLYNKMLMRLCSIILFLSSPLWCGDIIKLIIDTDMVGIIILSPKFTPGCSAGHWCGRRWSPVCGPPPGRQGRGGDTRCWLVLFRLYIGNHRDRQTDNNFELKYWAFSDALVNRTSQDIDFYIYNVRTCMYTCILIYLC